MLMDITPFLERRRRLIERMRAAGGGVAVIPTAPERMRNRDTPYPYRPDSYFYYLTGFGEPEAALVLIADETPQALLFCREKNAEKEIWDGFRFGPAGARERFGFDAAYPIDSFDAKLAELIIDQPALWYALGHDAAWDARITAALNGARAQSRAGKSAPATFHDVRVALDALRLIKDAEEIALMRKAAQIAAAAHRRAMRAAAPGKYEYELEADILHELRSHGCAAPAYAPIVAGGAHACILHYVDNDQPLRDGELVLIDAGGEFACYASDITRTFPVNGRFSAAQAALYAVVLDAQRAALAAVRPGASCQAPHEAALRVLVQGMVDLGLLTGSIDGVIESGAYKRFFMHRTSHWLGLDVHDAGPYRNGENWTTLQPGMTLTIEPGLYVRAADDVPAAFHDIGIRIEDDVLVTDAGCEILSAAAPKTIDEIEAWMQR